MPYNPDFNAGQQEGCALYQTTIRNGTALQHRGRAF